MSNSFLRIQPVNNAGTRPWSLIRILGQVTCVVCSLLLPFYLLDGANCQFNGNGQRNSVFMNALLFYLGHNKEDGLAAAPNPDRYIAIVTYIGIQNDADMENVKSSVDNIIRNQVTSAFERKGLRLPPETNKVTNIRLYYNKERTSIWEQEVTVFCFVTSRAAIALVVV